MKKRQTWVTIFPALVGGIILICSFADVPILNVARKYLLVWAITMFAVLLIFSTLDSIISQLRFSTPNSPDLIIHAAGFASFLVMLMIGLPNGTNGELFTSLVGTVQSSVETTLAGLICPAFIFALYKLPSNRSERSSAMVYSFFWGFFLFLFIESGILDYLAVPQIAIQFIEWLKCIPLGAFIGILLGVAIGAIITGIRFIFFGSHPYKERK